MFQQNYRVCVLLKSALKVRKQRYNSDVVLGLGCISFCYLFCFLKGYQAIGRSEIQQGTEASFKF